MLRASVPRLDLDEVFLAKEELAKNVEAELGKVRNAPAIFIKK